MYPRESYGARSQWSSGLLHQLEDLERPGVHVVEPRRAAGSRAGLSPAGGTEQPRSSRGKRAPRETRETPNLAGQLLLDLSLQREARWRERWAEWAAGRRP